MARLLKFIGIGVLLVLLPAVVGLAVLSVFSGRPNNLGVANGRLAPCPDTPNCVSTQADNPTQLMEPLSFTGEPAEVIGKLKRIIGAMPRTQIVTEDQLYLHAEVTSAVFRFVDDVEFLIDPAGRRIHFRSASRAGRSDLGVNRCRMEAIRQAWEQAD